MLWFEGIIIPESELFIGFENNRMSEATRMLMHYIDKKRNISTHEKGKVKSMEM